tara:strand:+ start:676 stop:1014 length:339 start_codon:yes stop_codon:yes gene_type:complete
MIFNLFKRKSREEFDYRAGGMLIKRIPNLKGEEGMRIRIEVGNKDFISLSNCLHIGRAAQLAKHEADPVNQFKFNSRINKQINTLRYLSTALVNEHRAKKGKEPLAVMDSND